MSPFIYLERNSFLINHEEQVITDECNGFDAVLDKKWYD